MKLTVVSLETALIMHPVGKRLSLQENLEDTNLTTATVSNLTPVDLRRKGPKSKQSVALCFIWNLQHSYSDG